MLLYRREPFHALYAESDWVRILLKVENLCRTAWQQQQQQTDRRRLPMFMFFQRQRRPKTKKKPIYGLEF